MMLMVKLTLIQYKVIREFAFQCELCSAVSVVDFDQVCNPASFRIKERKERKN